VSNIHANLGKKVFRERKSKSEIEINKDTAVDGGILWDYQKLSKGNFLFVFLGLRGFFKIV